MSEDIVNLGPNILFNRSLWRADFVEAAAKIKLLCEQWQYARPCECKVNDADFDVCEMCEAVDEIYQAVMYVAAR